MRVFITGGTGFLGKAVCAALAGHDLLVLTRSPGLVSLPASVPLLAGSLGEISGFQAAVAQFQPDACIHLAWEGLPDYSPAACERNFQATMALYHLLLGIRCPRVVVAGTCWEYGAATGCVSEEMAVEPRTLTPFPACKTQLRQEGESLFAATRQTFVWTRPFFIYGPGQRLISLLPTAFSALSSGRTPEIKSASAINDFIHVDDVAAGIATLATTAAPSGIYNLGSGEPTRVRDVVNLLASELRIPAVFPPSDEAATGMWANTQRMRNATGWQPKISLAEGIHRTVAAWRNAA